MARKYTRRTSQSSKKSTAGRKTSTGPRRSVKKSKPTVKKFTARQLRAYVDAVAQYRSGNSEE